MSSKTGNLKVAEEVAAVEFDRLCDANRIDRDETNLDEKELAEWHELRGKIINDICRGWLVVDAEGRAVFSPTTGKAITFSPATGSTLMALETHGKGKDVSNMVAAMADMTGANKGDFARMNAKDFQACGRLARLFLSEQ